jgi:hypothetical protein
MTSQVPPNIQNLPSERLENEDSLDTANWYFYRYINDQCPAWPGLLGTANRERTKLVAIINDVLIMMYDRQNPPVTAEHFLQLYSRFMTWRKELPDDLGNIENNNSQALPHVLSLL